MAALSGLFRRIWPGRGRRSQYQWQVGTTREGGMSAPYWPVIIEAGAAPQTYTFAGDVGLTPGVGSAQTYTAAEPAALALELGAGSGVAVVRVEAANAGIAVGVSAAVEFVAGSLSRGRGGFEPSRRPKPRPVVYEWNGRVSLRLAVNATVSNVRVFGGSGVGMQYIPRAHRVFVVFEDDVEIEELVLAGVV